MRKISGTIQRRNDELVGILGPDLHTAALPAGEDHFPNADGRGLATRFINPAGLTTWTAHFRPGETTGPGNGTLTGFSWQGAPFTTPSATNYSLNNEYFGFYHGAAARFFLSRPITNSGTAWQNKIIVARLAATHYGAVGLRIDDGTDNNYTEIYLDATAADGGQRLRFAYRSGGGAVTTSTAGVVLLQGTFVVLRLLCYYSAAYTFFGYTVSESGLGNNHFDTPALSWCPAAGRVGIVGQSAAACNPQTIDWFYTDFG